MRTSILLGWLVFCLGWMSGVQGQTPRPTPAEPVIAVMSAYEPEMAAIERLAIADPSAVKVTRINGITFKKVKIGQRQFLFFLSGVSMVNAAMTTQLAIDRFGVSHVLFTGIAGGINPKFNVGDVVIPERWYHHSEAAYFNPKPDGSGYIVADYFKPKYENFGWLFPDDVWVIREGMDKPEKQPYFDADPALLGLARQVLIELPELKAGERKVRVNVTSVGISGPVFLDNAKYREWAFKVWGASCTDMESTAIAQVCWANKVPFLVVRGLSDLAGGQEGKNPERENTAMASHHAAVVLWEIMQRL